METPAVGLGAKDEEEVANKIADAESAEVIESEVGITETFVPGTEGRIEGDPKASEQHQAMDDVKHQGGDGDAERAGIAEIGSPSN